MAESAKTIHIDDATPLSRVLVEADEGPILLAKGDAVYRVVREGEISSRDAAVIAAVDATSASWSDLDADAVIDYIYRGREEGTRPATRL